MNPFPQNLKAARKEKGYTKQDMADLLDIKLSRYIAWEEGRAEPSIEYLVKLCEILEIDDLYLFLSKEMLIRCRK